MAKYWTLSEGNVLGPFSAEEVIRLPDFNPEIPVCPAEGASANWLSAGSIPEIAAASKHLAFVGPPSASGEGLEEVPGPDKSADAGLRPSESGRPSRHVIPSVSGEEMAESLESIESRIARLDSRLERREEIVDEVAQRILDFHRLFNKHLNTLRDQWDQERSQFRSTIEVRIDKRAIQLEDALCKANQMQSLLNEAFRTLEEEKESYRAFIAENLHQDLEKKFLKMKDELLQITEKTGEGLNNAIQQRMEDFSHRLESKISALQELESKIRPKQYRLEGLIEREENLNHMLESGLRHVHPLGKQDWTDETAGRFREKASADIFSELERRIHQTKELGKNLSEYFTGLRSGWEKDKDAAFEGFKKDNDTALEKLKADSKLFQSNFKAIKSTSEDFQESTKKYQAQIDELKLVHDRISELLRSAGQTFDRQKQEWETKGKESLSWFRASLGLRLKEWENTLAGRFKNWEDNAQREIGEIKQSIQKRASADLKEHIRDVSEPLEKLIERIENLEQQFAKSALDLKTQTVRSELPVVIGRVEDLKDRESPVPEQDAGKRWKFKDNFVLVIILLALLASLALFFLSH